MNNITRYLWANLASDAIKRRAEKNAPLAGHPVATASYPPEGKPLAEGWQADADAAIERRKRRNG